MVDSADGYCSSSSLIWRFTNQEKRKAYNTVAVHYYTLHACMHADVLLWGPQE